MDKQVTPETLNSVMEFDHIIRVAEDGTVSDTDMSVGSTEAYFDLNVDSNGNDEFEMSAGWTLLQGYTGQHGYNGPVMHPSEFIGGRMARDILSTPGYYVALVVNGTDPHDWQVSTFTGTKTCSRCGLLPLDEDDMESECRSEEPAGWAVAYKELEA